VENVSGQLVVASTIY